MVKPCTQASPHHHRQASGTEWLERAVTLLRQEKHRVSQARMHVLLWVAGRDTAFTAEEIVADLDTRLGFGSRPTAYRLLQLLRSHHLLTRVTVYQCLHAYLRQLPNHHPVICVACGTWVLVGGIDLAAPVAVGLAGSGFVPQYQELMVYGVCGACGHA